METYSVWLTLKCRDLFEPQEPRSLGSVYFTKSPPLPAVVEPFTIIGKFWIRTVGLKLLKGAHVFVLSDGKVNVCENVLIVLPQDVA